MFFYNWLFGKSMLLLFSISMYLSQSFFYVYVSIIPFFIGSFT